MGKIIFILGGARSGKSQYALKLVDKKKKKVAFIAICEPRDREMKRRIAIHKKNRPVNWQTFEEPQNVSALLKTIGKKFDVIIIECLTLLVSNLLLNGLKEDAVESEIREILSICKKIKGKIIIVSNEVGLGIVPGNKLARNFRDIAGRINQIVAENSHQVFFMVSGLAWRIK